MYVFSNQLSKGQCIPVGLKHLCGCSPSVFSHSHFLGWESSPCVVLLLLSPMSTLLKQLEGPNSCLMRPKTGGFSHFCIFQAADAIFVGSCFLALWLCLYSYSLATALLSYSLTKPVLSAFLQPQGHLATFIPPDLPSLGTEWLHPNRVCGFCSMQGLEKSL